MVRLPVWRGAVEKPRAPSLQPTLRVTVPEPPVTVPALTADRAVLGGGGVRRAGATAEAGQDQGGQHCGAGAHGTLRATRKP